MARTYMVEENGLVLASCHVTEDDHTHKQNKNVIEKKKKKEPGSGGACL